MAWTPLENLSTDLADGNGIVRLWCPPNYMDSQGWSTKPNFSNWLYSYFFVPANFYQTGENEFTYNFPFKYIKKYVEVYHEGIQRSEDFWRLEENQRKNC